MAASTLCLSVSSGFCALPTFLNEVQGFVLLVAAFRRSLLVHEGLSIVSSLLHWRWSAAATVAMGSLGTGMGRAFGRKTGLMGLENDSVMRNPSQSSAPLFLVTNLNRKNFKVFHSGW